MKLVFFDTFLVLLFVTVNFYNFLVNILNHRPRNRVFQFLNQEKNVQNIHNNVNNCKKIISLQSWFFWYMGNQNTLRTCEVKKMFIFLLLFHFSWLSHMYKMPWIDQLSIPHCTQARFNLINLLTNETGCSQQCNPANLGASVTNLSAVSIER